MLFYKQPEIESWERFFRANFINSLTGFESIMIIETANQQIQRNLNIAQ